MALVKVSLASGNEVEIEMPGDKADELVATFARAIAEGKLPGNRTIIDANQSFYIDFSKVAIVRREF